MKYVIYDREDYQKIFELHLQDIDILCPKCKTKLVLNNDLELDGTITFYCPENYKHIYRRIATRKHFFNE